jgi:hypothetical protein
MTEWNPRVSKCPLASGQEDAELLLDYVSRKLEPELMDVFSRHVAACAACREFTVAQTAVWEALDAFEAEPVSEDFDRALWAKIEQQESRRWWRRGWDWLTSAPLWQPAIPVAAMLLVAVGLWVQPGSDPAGGAVTKAEASLDAEQIDNTLEDLEMLQQFGLTESGAPRQM